MSDLGFELGLKSNTPTHYLKDPGDFMHRLREAILRKRTVLWKNTSTLVREFLVNNKTVNIPQLQYSPDLASADS